MKYLIAKTGFFCRPVLFYIELHCEILSSQNHRDREIKHLVYFFQIEYETTFSTPGI